MTTQELINYIQKQIDKNITKDIITNKLVEAGWKKEDIEEGFSRISSRPNPISTTLISSAPQKTNFDPYRESPLEKTEQVKSQFSTPTTKQPEVAQAWPIKQPEIQKQEFMPTLKPKTEQVFRPVNPTTTMSTFSPTINPASVPVVNKVETKKKPKLALWAISILILGALVGGIIFAYNKNLLKINLPINLPFTKLSSEEIIQKTIDSIPNINMNKTEGTISYLPKTEGQTDLNANIKFINGKIYVNSASLISLLQDDSLSSDLWVSFDTYNLPANESSDNTLVLLENNINENILNILKKISIIKDLAKDVNFISSIKEIGEENVEGVMLNHYQILIAGDTKVDVWADGKNYEIKKFDLSTASDTANIKTSFILSSLDQPVSIVEPSESRVFHDLITESIIKNEILGKDEILKSSMSAIFTEAEKYKEKYKSYGKANTSGSCSAPVAGSLFYTSTTNTKAKPISDIVNLILGTMNGGGSCYSTTKEWAVAFPLFSAPDKFYCVDSTGASKEITTILNKAICE